MQRTVPEPKWIPKAEFDEIYSRVPRLSVDLVVRTPDGIVFTKRSIEPCLGQWHLPGGTVWFGEKLSDTARRIARSEIGVEIEVVKHIGFIEYTSLYGEGFDGWPIAVVFEAKITGGQLKGSDQGEEVGLFKLIPDNTIKDQAKFLATVL